MCAIEIEILYLVGVVIFSETLNGSQSGWSASRRLQRPQRDGNFASMPCQLPLLIVQSGLRGRSKTQSLATAVDAPRQHQRSKPHSLCSSKLQPQLLMQLLTAAELAKHLQLHPLTAATTSTAATTAKRKASLLQLHSARPRGKGPGRCQIGGHHSRVCHDG